MAMLKQAEASRPVPDLCSKRGVSMAAFNKLRTRFSSIDVSLMSEMTELENENRQLGNMYVDPQMRVLIVEEALTKKLPGHLSGAGWPSKQCCSAVWPLPWPAWHLGSVKLFTATMPSDRPRMKKPGRSASPAGRKQPERGLWALVFAT